MLLPKEKRTKKKKGQPDEAHVHLHIGIFYNLEKMHPYPVLSLFWEENILVGLRRKHLSPTIYFPSSPSNQTHSKKVFFPIFFLKFSIHPISPQKNHTLKVWEKEDKGLKRMREEREERLRISNGSIWHLGTQLCV